MKLDDKDMDILGLLKKNAKSTTQQISRAVGVPITTVHNRIKKMERDGVIKKYTIWVNYKKLGKGITARIAINVGGEGDQDEISAKLLQHKDVVCTYQVTGTDDIIVKLNVGDVNELHSFIMDEVRTKKGVTGTRTLIVLKEFRK